MASYKTNKGFAVQTLASDTAASVAATGTWASAPNLNAACTEGGGSGGPTTAINVGGYPYPMTNEHWNGSTWATFANLGTARGKNAVAGNYTNALVGNGSTPGTPGIGIINNVETWNGSAWSEITEINSIRDANGMSANGTSTAVIYFGGNAPGGVSALNEQWNGSSWVEKADLNTARANVVGMGTTTAALAASGYPSNSVAESWNGSSWTNVASLNTARNYPGGSSGTQTSALVFGGNPQKTNTESWDGTSWTEVNDLATGRESLKGAGSNGTSALAYGGYTTTAVANTEEWTTTPAADFTKQNLGQVYYNSGSNAFKVTQTVFGTGAFSSGGALPTVKSAHGFAGTQTAGVAFAGATSTTAKVATSYEYNGSAWSNAENVNTTRDLCAGAGTQTAAILFGGTLPPGGHSNATELYDGTDWTTSPGSLNTARSRIGPLGTQTATLAVAGTPPGTSAVESWNGSAWTEIAEINTARMNGGAAGIQTAGLFFGGESPLTGKTEKWDGSSWTEVGDMNTARQSSGQGAGNSNTNALAIGGEISPGFTANAEAWNGSSWTEVANLATARGYHGCGGTGSTAIATGGRTPTFVANTEEWTVPSTVTNTTITD